jgi:HSP20 family molecular chaperone IbpA
MTRATSTTSAAGTGVVTRAQAQRQSLRVRTAAEDAFHHVHAGSPASVPCPGQEARRRQERERERRERADGRCVRDLLPWPLVLSWVTVACSVPTSAATSPQAGPAAGEAAPTSRSTWSQRRFVIRTDLHFDEAGGQMTALLELPGVKKADLTLTLSTCPYTRARQLTVAGRCLPAWDEGARGWAVRERKYGHFSRMIAVPPDTRVRALSFWRPSRGSGVWRVVLILRALASSFYFVLAVFGYPQAEDVVAEMNDGILMLKIPLGQPLPREDPVSVPII